MCQVTVTSKRTEPITTAMMEEVVRRKNLKKALKRVCTNKGIPGTDEMTTDEVKDHLKVHCQRFGRRYFSDNIGRSR